jgi:hypothetical protein
MSRNVGMSRKMTQDCKEAPLVASRTSLKLFGSMTHQVINNLVV